MNATQNYYTLLGVATDASPAAIKAAFKKLALQYHPDVYKGEDAHERMRQLLLAYKTLSDVQTRKAYDQSLSLDDARSTTTARERKVVSPGARRDRQRHYAFPGAEQGKPVTVDLVEITYTLSAQEWQVLSQRGMLRGVAPETRNKAYYCHRCHYHWHVTTARGKAERWDVPRFCPQCKAWDWPEYLLMRCIYCDAVFESEQIRYEVGQYSYGDAKHPVLCPPYELFPLCPYCSAAHWCPAEEERVRELRRQQERHQALMRLLWIGVGVALMMVIGVVALGLLR